MFNNLDDVSSRFNYNRLDHLGIHLRRLHFHIIFLALAHICRGFCVRAKLMGYQNAPRFVKLLRTEQVLNLVANNIVGSVLMASQQMFLIFMFSMITFIIIDQADVLVNPAPWPLCCSHISVGNYYSNYDTVFWMSFCWKLIWKRRPVSGTVPQANQTVTCVALGSLQLQRHDASICPSFL